MFFSSIKKINRLISKGIYKRFTIEKNWRSQNFDLEMKCTGFEEEKGTRYIGEKVYFGIIVFSCLLPGSVFRLKPCLRFLLSCFPREIKSFYQSSLGNEFDFADIMNLFPNILAKNWNIKKLRHFSVDERAMISTTLISSCHWKTVIPFCLW